MPDINGFDPFFHKLRFFGPDFFLGPYSQWKFPDYKNTAGFADIVARPDLWTKK